MGRIRLSLVWVAVGAGVLSAQSPQQPQFRGGTEIVAIDFLASQSDGQPIADLTAKDITLKVDGRVREIKSFQFVKLSPTTHEVPGVLAKLPPPFAANDGVSPGRNVIIVVDHEAIRASEAKAATTAASRFLDRLTPFDRVGVVTMPHGTVEVDLTTNHDRVREALVRVTGRALRPSAGISRIGVDEAMTILGERHDPDKPLTQDIIDRECKAAMRMNDTSCPTRVLQDALFMARQIEVQTRNSLTALKEFFDGLGGIDGPKSVLYLSGQLVSFPETKYDMDDVARAAARARAQMFVVQPHDTIADASVRDAPTSLARDIDHRKTGLEDLAGVTGGEMFRMSGAGDLVFRRIADQISSHYLIGFEPQGDDRNGKPHKIQITTSRRAVDIRARPLFVVDDPKKAPPAPSGLEPVLRDFATYRDLPLRAVARVFRDADPKLLKVVVVVDPIEAGATLNSAAFALISVNGQAAAEWREDGANVVTRPLTTAAAVPPGDYRLRVVAVDTNGRRGAVDYEFKAALTEEPRITLSSVMVGRSEQGTFRPQFQFGPDSKDAAAYVEFYGSFVPGAALTARIELADSPKAPARASGDGHVQASSNPTRFLATGDLPLDAIPPGDYLLRVIVLLDGKALGQASTTVRKNP